MMVQEGRLDVGGTIAYVPQTPWVQNLSLRDNILFGMPYDEQKYTAVIHACALELDLKILPNGRCPNCCPKFRQTVGWLVLHGCKTDSLTVRFQHTFSGHCILGHQNPLMNQMCFAETACLLHVLCR